jgi:hypothetical protein
MPVRRRLSLPEQEMNRGLEELLNALFALSPPELGEVAFHGTSMANLDAILKDGIVPHGGAGADAWVAANMPNAPIKTNIIDKRTQAFVYVSADNGAEVEKYAQLSAELTKSDPVVIEVRIPKDQIESFSRDDGGDIVGFRRAESIPKEWLGDYCLLKPDFRYGRLIKSES